jgi:DNA-binding transcriptional LysR family regulator
MELRHLRYFTAVVQWKGYREASRQLHVAQAAISVGFAWTLTAVQNKTFSSRHLYDDPMMAVLPASRHVKTKCVRISDLAKESFVLFHREGYPPLFDTIIGMCSDAGFSPRVECKPDMMQTVLTLVEAGRGISIVPACVRNLRSDGVRFYRLQPDEVRVELVAAWKKETPSAALRAFLN